MSWIFFSLLSAVVLGVYDIAKKASVHDNAVPAVLLLNTMTAALIWTVVLVANSTLLPERVPALDAITAIGFDEHLLLASKSLLVGGSWTCAFFALKHLPVSIATPIRSTSPIWTIAVAVLAFGEAPTTAQWLGVALIVVAFLALSRVGQREGIDFRRNAWIFLMVAATLLGAASGLYDKYLLQSERLPVLTVQAWFSIYLVPVTLPMFLLWYFRSRQRTPFYWRWSIPTVAVLLLVTDLLYFTAVSDPDALIAVVSPLRRTSVFVAFLYAVLFLKEENWKAKAPCIVAMILGVFLIALG